MTFFTPVCLALPYILPKVLEMARSNEQFQLCLFSAPANNKSVCDGGGPIIEKLKFMISCRASRNLLFYCCCVLSTLIGFQHNQPQGSSAQLGGVIEAYTQV